MPPSVPLVVTEGNYLLLDTAPWSAIRGLLGEVWFLAPDDQTRRGWLTARHLVLILVPSGLPLTD